jgi:hypothetical protein
LYDTLASRADLEIEVLNIPQPSQVLARLSGRVRFLDGSLLDWEEEVRPKGARGIEKIHYSYHFQRADGATIFRYDNAPHHRKIKSFPHHKHAGEKIEASAAPDLHEVLQEIDRIQNSKRTSD